MPKPPQLAPFNSKQQQLSSELPPDFQVPHLISKPAYQGNSFQALVPCSCSQISDTTHSWSSGSCQLIKLPLFSKCWDYNSKTVLCLYNSFVRICQDNILCIKMGTRHLFILPWALDNCNFSLSIELKVLQSLASRVHAEWPIAIGAHLSVQLHYSVHFLLIALGSIRMPVTKVPWNPWTQRSHKKNTMTMWWINYLDWWNTHQDNQAWLVGVGFALRRKLAS